VINNTYVDNSRHTTYIAGPARTDIQRATGRQVNPVAIQEYNKPGQDMNNGKFRIYRPEVARSNGGGVKPAPSRITNLKDVRQPSQRNATNEAENIKKEAQPNNVKPQNSNPPQNIRREAQPNNVKPQNSNPPQNIRKEAQPNNVKPQNSNPPQNIRKEAQPDNVKKMNTNPPKKTSKAKQSNTLKSSENSKKDQKKKSDNADDIKKNE
jgi:hypothetical protein